MRDDQKANFDAWFGDSKVVDAAGKPLVVYHGTTADFSEFAPGGAFFTPNPESTQHHAAGEGGRVLPVYVSLQNPAHLSMLPPNTRAATAKHLRGLASKGHDGAIVDFGADGKTMYIAFASEQIKSAIGNSGLYERTNRDITDRIAAASKAQDFLTGLDKKKAAPHV